MDVFIAKFNKTTFPEGSYIAIVGDKYAVYSPTIPVTLATDPDPLTAIEKAKRKLGNYR